MTDNYSPDYAALGVKPGCTWKELQTAYRRLVQITHPDRFPPGTREKELAEERIKQVNRAFQKLSDYHQLHGALPDPEPFASEILTHPSEPRAPGDVSARKPASDNAEKYSEPTHILHTTTDFYAQERRKSGALIWIIITAIAVFLLADEIFTTSPDEPPPVAMAEPSFGSNESRNVADMRATQAPPALTSIPGKTFTIGSSMGEVVGAQGAPTATEKDTWHYGHSRVNFKNGVVTSWTEAPSHPLRADPGATRLRPTTNIFTVGSSKRDVRAAMGPPLFEYEDVWDYGASKIYFRNDKVTRWENSPLRPLKARQ